VGYKIGKKEITLKNYSTCKENIKIDPLDGRVQNGLI
jgi:hypothetical protein